MISLTVILLIFALFKAFELRLSLIKRYKNKEIAKTCSDLKDKLRQLKLFCKTDEEYIEFEKIINYHLAIYCHTNGKYPDIKVISNNIDCIIEFFKHNTASDTLGGLYK